MNLQPEKVVGLRRHDVNGAVSVKTDTFLWRRIYSLVPKDRKKINEDDESESSTRKSESSVCSALSLRTK